jgi:hypothetical protein
MEIDIARIHTFYIHFVPRHLLVKQCIPKWWPLITTELLVKLKWVVEDFQSSQVKRTKEVKGTLMEMQGLPGS